MNDYKKYLIFSNLFKNFTLEETIKESIHERKCKNFKSIEFIYGEIGYESIKEIYLAINKNFPDFKFIQNKSFVDLGSGIGKSVFASALLEDFNECVGIEILENLYTISITMKELYDSQMKTNNISNKSTQVNFLCQNLNDYDFSNHTVVFTNSTCWGDDTIKLLSLKLQFMKTNSFFIYTDNRKFNLNKGWNKLPPIDLKMSWGIAKTFICRKI